MLRTDFNGRVWHLRSVCLLFVLFLLGAPVIAGNFNDGEPTFESIVCNDQINVSLDEVTCDAVITPDMVVEGPMNWFTYSYSVRVVGPYPSAAEVPLVPIPGPGNLMFPKILEKGNYKVTITQTGRPQGPNAGEENWCWGNILVEDKTDPVIVDTDVTVPDNQLDCPYDDRENPFELTLFCTQLEDFLLGFYTDGVPRPAAEDNCAGTDLTMSFVDEFVEGNPSEMCDELLIKRVYYFDDGCGNKTGSCDYYYLINPLNIEDILEQDLIAWPHRTTVPCGTGTSPQDLYDYYYSREYNKYIQMFLEELLMNDPHATVNDIDPDDIKHAEYESNHNAIQYSYPVLFDTVLDEGTFCNLAVVYDDELIPICGSGCDYSDKVIRIWKVYDWCDGGDPAEHTQIIEAFDTDGPEILVEDVLLSVDPWGCFGDFYMPEPIKLYDACSSVVTYTVTGPPDANIIYEQGYGWHVTNAPKGQYEYYYHAFDCCENETTVGITVTVVDNTQPIAIAKQDIVISLVSVNQGSDGSTGITKIYARNLDNGSFDSCSEVHLEIRREEDYCSRDGNATFNDDGHPFDDEDDLLDQGNYVTFCCTDISDNGIDADGDGINDYALLKVWLRVWDDGDMDGQYGTSGDNYNEVWGYVRVEDKAQPELLCPLDITIDCSGDAWDFDLVGEGMALNACGSASAEFTDEKDLNGCGAGIITRTWFVSGYPDIYCEQEITVEPSDSGTVTVWWPDDLETDCTDDLSDEIPTWATDNPCDLIAYTVDVDTFYLEQGACYQIAKRWTVVNWCDFDPYHSSWSHLQIIKVIDNDKPFFTACEDLVLEADDYNDIDQDGIICENNAVMLTAVADDVGDCASPWMKWNIEVDLDDDGWVEFVYSSSLISSDPFYVQPTLAGSQVKITLPDGIRGSMASHSVKWRVTDGCGNIAICETRFMVVDQKPPTPYCVNLSTALMENGQVELWACDFDLGSFDNCTSRSNLRFTFTDTPPSDDPNFNEALNCSSRAFTCDDALSQNPTPVTLYVWDEKENFDYCVVTLTLVDNQGSCGTSGNRASISGKVFTEHGDNISDVMVSLNSALPESPNHEMTDDTGEYMFEDKTMYVDYTVSGERDMDYLNGVSTLDLVLVQKHILGQKYLVGPYKLIAADVNNDEKVSTIDLIELRKLILGIYTELPANNSWRFIPESEELNIADPWPFTEELEVNDLSLNMTNENLIGVKVGDVNESASYSFRGESTEGRSSGELSFSIADQYVKAGETVKIDFSSADFQEVFGYQMTMNFDGMELLDVIPAALDLDDDNVAVFGEQMTMSWNTIDAVSSDALLFSLELKANTSGSVSEMLSINSMLTPAEAYVGNQLEIVSVSLRTQNDTNFALYQNVPNPFSGTTTIAFELPDSSDATLSVYDMTGKLIKQVQGSFEQGYNEVELDSREFNSTGILYYELQSGNYTSTKKMIVIN